MLLAAGRRGPKISKNTRKSLKKSQPNPQKGRPKARACPIGRPWPASGPLCCLQQVRGGQKPQRTRPKPLKKAAQSQRKGLARARARRLRPLLLPTLWAALLAVLEGSGTCWLLEIFGIFLVFFLFFLLVVKSLILFRYVLRPDQGEEDTPPEFYHLNRRKKQHTEEDKRRSKSVSIPKKLEQKRKKCAQLF